MFSYQKTLSNKVSCVGVGLHTGVKINLTLNPAAADSGIVFKRIDVLDQNNLIEGLTRQISNPVRWADIIRYFIKKDIGIAIEFGSGVILSGLCKRIDKSIRAVKFDSINSIDLINELIAQKLTPEEDNE